jgi:hypothetical protein
MPCGTATVAVPDPVKWQGECASVLVIALSTAADIRTVGRLLSSIVRLVLLSHQIPSLKVVHLIGIHTDAVAEAEL